MPIKEAHFAVFDFETTGLDHTKDEPYEIGCKIYNGRSLEFIPGAEFSFLCKPNAQITQESLDITKIPIENINNAVSINVIYPKFCDFLLKYNPEQNKWTAPIPCGHNIINFDLPFHWRMCQTYAKKNKVTFNTIKTIDLMHLAQYWFSNTNETPSDSLNTIRDFFGIPTKGSHRAMKDVEDSGWIIMRFMKFYRELSKVYLPKMKNIYKKEQKIESELLVTQ